MPWSVVQYGRAVKKVFLKKSVRHIRFSAHARFKKSSRRELVDFLNSDTPRGATGGLLGLQTRNQDTRPLSPCCGYYSKGGVGI